MSPSETKNSRNSSKRVAGTLYRGNAGMWAWVLHRITGITIFFFLLVHILDTSLIRLSPDAYNAVIGSYKNPFMGLVEIGLVAAIIFHALNGIRIMLIDACSWGTRYQKIMLWIIFTLWIILMIGFVPIQLSHMFAKG